MAFRLDIERKESEVKAIRFPKKLLNKIYASIEGKDITFSRFVTQACEYALENLETDSNDSTKYFESKEKVTK